MAVGDVKDKDDTGPDDLSLKNDIQVGVVEPEFEQSEEDQKAIKRIVRKLDLRLIPTLAIIYSFALIDRVNLPNARIAGMGDDLQLSVGNRYSLLVLMFFVPYVIFELPSNIFIRKIGPSIWLPSIVIAWGVTSVGMGFTKKWDQMLVCRLILGALEAGFYPGCIYLLSCWYVRFEVQTRFSLFLLLGLMSTGFSNILAYGLSLMDGVGGLRGWRWIFILEGIITVVLGLAGYFFIVDFPDKASKPGPIIRKPFLTEKESKIMADRINRDRGDAELDKLTIKTVLLHLKDWKVWEYAWLYLLNNVVTYSFSYFLSIILKEDMGYSTMMAQVLSFPPYCSATIYMLVVAWFADRYRQRGSVVVGNCCMIIIGVSMMAYLSTSGARYAGVYLGLAGIYSNVTTLLSYQHNNIVGQTKRAVASALLIGGGACGGIAASNIFRQQDAPQYRPAMITVICTQALSILHVLKNFYIYSRENRRADRKEIILEGQVGFRYTL